MGGYPWPSGLAERKPGGGLRFAKDTLLIVDGILVPIGDRQVAEQSMNYRYSTNHEIVIDADTRLVVVGGRLCPATATTAR